MRVTDAMSAAGINASGAPIEEAWVVATCQGCKAEHRLSHIDVRESGQQTEYVCPDCDEVFVIVGPAPGLTGGYRLKDNVVNPLGGMRMGARVVPPPVPPCDKKTAV
jgi:hypothetical protein